MAKNAGDVASETIIKTDDQPVITNVKLVPIHNFKKGNTQSGAATKQDKPLIKNVKLEPVN